MTNGSGVGPGPSGPARIVFPQKDVEEKIVIPATHIGSSTAVQFINNTGGLARLWIPQAALLFRAPDNNVIDVQIADGDTRQLELLDTAPDGTYPYHVYCESVGDYARGGSPPTMICP